MVLGRGTIASIIPDREGFLFFACGESNRFPLTMERAEAELKKILKCPKDGMFVYISGLNIYYPETDRREEFTAHKLGMEAVVRAYFNNYCIFRIGTVTWGDNPNTIINHIRKEVKETGYCKVRPGYRYLHTKEELQHWFNMIPTTGRHEMNVTGKMVWVPELVEMIKNGEI